MAQRVMKLSGLEKGSQNSSESKGACVRHRYTLLSVKTEGAPESLPPDGGQQRGQKGSGCWTKPGHALPLRSNLRGAFCSARNSKCRRRRSSHPARSLCQMAHRKAPSAACSATAAAEPPWAASAGVAGRAGPSPAAFAMCCTVSCVRGSPGPPVASSGRQLSTASAG